MGFAVRTWALSGQPFGAVPRARHLLVLLLAVTGVLVGLLGMHGFEGTSHATRDAAHTPAAHVVVDDGGPAFLHCAETGCDELGLMAASCVLALLALTLLLPASPVRWFVRTCAPPVRSFPLFARSIPTPSLIALSISRT
ncbi:DUF6153 family protein [Agrococcus baldri]|uniref:Uncharacterized protein n=1 Tax=Agrococcus baldri TaxID=153730 RepID=A0AA87USE6_9MICO|nr:DUF6153 family protein [Agrococcus baldri]GEK80594.1 hypothetical protein ABA31_19450 [Agrococcus baldri]